MEQADESDYTLIPGAIKGQNQIYSRQREWKKTSSQENKINEFPLSTHFLSPVEKKT